MQEVRGTGQEGVVRRMGAGLLKHMQRETVKAIALKAHIQHRNSPGRPEALAAVAVADVVPVGRAHCQHALKTT